MLQKYISCKIRQQGLLLCQALTLGLVLSPSLSVVAAELPPLPEPVSNQVVLSTSVGGKTYVSSFMGLGGGKSAKDVHNRAWQWTLGDPVWQAVSPVPSRARLTGRLAASGVAMQNHFFLFGGYTVAANGEETTSAESYRYSPVTRTYNKLPDMPVAVDDAVALSYQNRYIYLASGWSQDGNVNLMQRFDNFTQKWSQATPFPGTPTFGLAGAITGSVLVLCDGVAINYQPQPRQYQSQAQCWRGDIDAKDPAKISWQQLPHPTGTARYRMAAAEVTINGSTYLAFVGGSETAYNFNGIGYNGLPAEPSSAVWLFNPASNSWLLAQTAVGVMDLRTLLTLDGELYSLGGMLSGQQVTNQWTRHQIKLLP
ncbi:galactose oxidase [Rheinheimera sp.]|uniref:Kelch repeat-containing protein n=1 Tax=Rheinheimera sp. TaxID=1869214 RepID=UPI00307CD540